MLPEREMITSILIVIGCILIILLICRIVMIPFRIAGKLIWNSIIGFVMLAIFNLFGETLFHFTLEATPLHSLLAGILGVPGVALLIIVKLFF